jgi:hypothetical protein
MFVRFRERKSDGRKPGIVQAMMLCHGACDGMDYRGRRHRGCPCRPRCPWRIGWGYGLDPGLKPYRLLVGLIENHRVAGKISQEHVADLGAIDGHMLPGFYAGLDPATAAQVQGPKWMRRSVRERGWFWDALHDRLSRLANRIDAEARGKIMGAVHARIPMLTVDEREALPKWEAEEELKAWQSLHTDMTEHATDLLETATYLEKSIIRDRENAVALQDVAGMAAEYAKDVRNAIEQGTTLPREWVNLRKDAQMAFLGHLAGGVKDAAVVDGRLIVKKPTSSD